MPEMVRARSGVYFMLISRTRPGRRGSSCTLKPSMYPSRSRMLASASFNFEDGIGTVSCIATLALRIRVSMSAIGSVIVIAETPSPARLRHAGQLPRVCHLPDADAAQPEVAVDRTRPATAATPRVAPHLELGLAHLLLDECLLGHYDCCPSRRNGKPKASSSALPSALVRAVVTMVMSIPRGLSTLS